MPLYLVATPIGNLEDITMRALRVLGEADLIACEDTRHTGRLLEHFGIRKPTLSYHEHNEEARSRELVERLRQGQSIAIVSDAGTPGISDPAFRIVTAAIEAGIRVIPIPGATALIAGLVASGLPTDAFLFAGFLPARSQARRARLEALRAERATLVFYEAPHRIRATLADCLEILGDRPASLARELTKLHEEFLRGPLSTLRDHFDAQPPRGEMALVIAGNRDDNFLRLDDAPIRRQIDTLMREGGLDRTEAIREAARLRGLSKREAYQLLLEEKEREEDDENDISADEDRD